MKTILYLSEQNDVDLMKSSIARMNETSEADNLAVSDVKTAMDGEGFSVTVSHNHAADLYYLGLHVANQQAINGLNKLEADAKSL